jgi:hypothetical protein
LDALPGFRNPPRGYGEVPFYWWLGDTLTRAHITDHLNKLAMHGVTSLQVNYAHSDKGGITYGLTFHSKPAIFTDEWWKLFGWFMGEAKKRGITVSLSDYTLGVGQGMIVDKVLKAHPELKGSVLAAEQKETSGEQVSWTLSHEPLSIMAYRQTKSGTLDDATGIDLKAHVNGGVLTWKAPKGKWTLVNVYAQKVEQSYDPMNPSSGKLYVKNFFQQFEDRFPAISKGSLNFFFSDELDFKLEGLLWDDGFRAAFLQRKGYDIVPHLAALFLSAGPLTSKYRLDYNDVMVSLSEDNYFKVVYQWHEDRGLIFGCDHNSRGKDVMEFGDYFRSHRWYQAAGCDQPSLSKDIIKNKVASSIAHVYEHPRTWLEGFYGSGWNTSTSMLLDAIYGNFAEGQNVLSLHGLYYSTLGGWWEWAPPGNHFHEPYWAEMPAMLTMTERLSYLLSQGYHRADVAMLYPVEPVVAGDGDASVRCAFSLGEQLYRQGIDFDFIDYSSLPRAIVKDHMLRLSGEQYKVLIVPSMTTMHSASLQKTLEFQRSGGIVLAVDSLPRATELGLMDSKMAATVGQLTPCRAADVPAYIAAHVNLDFKTPTSEPYIMHRRVGFRDVYAVYNVPKGTKCYFRTHGAAQLWDPWTGGTKPLTVQQTDAEGSYLTMPLEATEMQLIVFDESEKPVVAPAPVEERKTVLTLDGDWNTEINPVLDNRWGDFSWPATPDSIGPEIRTLRYSATAEKGWNKPGFNDASWATSSMSYGNHFLCSGPLAQPLDRQLLSQPSVADKWASYAFSWRWGVEHDTGHQGYHGLKGEMYDDFIRLGRTQMENNGIFRVEDPRGRHYYLFTYVVAPADGSYKWVSGTTLPVEAYIGGKTMDLNTSTVSLKKGPNALLLHYLGPCTTYFVVIDPARSGQAVQATAADRPLSMKWNGDLSLLPFDVVPDQLEGYYRFDAAPGMESVTFTAYGTKLKAWVDGVSVPCQRLSERADGAVNYCLRLRHTQTTASKVAISMRCTNANFKQGGAFIAALRQHCGTGTMPLGDWGLCPGLAYYSGGITYRKSFTLPNVDATATYCLSLGDVVSTADLVVNGHKAGLRLCVPWTFDVTPYLRAGLNEISVKVYNTAHNHYLTVPTRYNAQQKSGIMGPVELVEIHRR